MPKLKASYTDKTAIPTEFFGLFTEKDGTFLLTEVEGLKPDSVVDEFRTNNIALQRKYDDLVALWKDLDPTEVRALVAKKQDLEDAKLVKKEGVDALVEQRLAVANTAHATALADKDKEIAKLDGKLSKLIIEDGVIRESLALGSLKPGADAFIKTHALTVFKVENGVEVAYEADGKTKKYNKEAKPFTLHDLATELLEKSSYLWVGNSGGGGQGGGRQGGGAYEGPNPFEEKTRNETEQARMIREQPEEAKRLHKAAGLGELQIMDIGHRGDSRDVNAGR